MLGIRSHMVCGLPRLFGPIEWVASILPYMPLLLPKHSLHIIRTERYQREVLWYFLDTLYIQCSTTYGLPSNVRSRALVIRFDLRA